MNDVVKNVFLFLMGVIVAFVLYILFFGTTDWNGGSIVPKLGQNNDMSRTVKMNHEWMGLLFYMTASVEANMSRYYNQYCYIPTVLKYIDIDKDLVFANQSDSLSVSKTTIVSDAEKYVNTVYKTNILPDTTAHATLVSNYMSVSPIDSLNNEVPVEINPNVTGSTLITNGDYYTTGWY